MFLSRLQRRFTAWVALLTLVLGALAPTVAQALVAGSDRADWLQVCSVSGMVWVQADTAAERLWSAEQLIKAQACGALLVWLPQARPEQIRRLQVLAAGFEAPVFVCRPARALGESSAAPLRVQAAVGPDWALHIHIAKRKGPPLDETLHLSAVPGGLSHLLPARLRQPSRRTPRQETEHVVVRPSAQPDEHRHSSAH